MKKLGNFDTRKVKKGSLGNSMGYKNVLQAHESTDHLPLNFGKNIFLACFISVLKILFFTFRKKNSTVLYAESKNFRILYMGMKIEFCSIIHGNLPLYYNFANIFTKL